QSGRGERDTDANLIVGAADPGKFRGIETRALLVEQRIEGGAPADRADDATVTRRRRIKVIGEPQAAGAFHILRHDGGISLHMLTEAPGDQAGIEVVTAADTVADVEFDRFAPVELRRALRARHGDEDDKSSDRECRCGNRKSSRFHADPLSTVGARSSTFWHTQRMPQSLRARHCTGGRNPLNDGAKWRA